jgi:hypothetical protein
VQVLSPSVEKLQQPLTSEQLDSARSEPRDTTAVNHQNASSKPSSASHGELDGLIDVGVAEPRRGSVSVAAAQRHKADVPPLSTARIDCDEQRELVEFGPLVSSMQCSRNVALQ